MSYLPVLRRVASHPRPEEALVRGKIWPVLLGILLIVLGISALGWISIDSDIIGIAEIITGVLLLLNK